VADDRQNIENDDPRDLDVDEAEAARRAARIAQIDTSVAHPARVYDYWLGGCSL
jgi:hypothetical protein